MRFAPVAGRCGCFRNGLEVAQDGIRETSTPGPPISEVAEPAGRQDPSVQPAMLRVDCRQMERDLKSRLEEAIDGAEEGSRAALRILADEIVKLSAQDRMNGDLYAGLQRHGEILELLIDSSRFDPALPVFMLHFGDDGGTPASEVASHAGRAREIAAEHFGCESGDVRLTIALELPDILPASAKAGHPGLVAGPSSHADKVRWLAKADEELTLEHLRRQSVPGTGR